MRWTSILACLVLLGCGACRTARVPPMPQIAKLPPIPKLPSSDPQRQLWADIDRLATIPDFGSDAGAASIARRIAAIPAVVSAHYRPRIQDPATEEGKRVVYIWALGQTHDPALADDYIRCYRAFGFKPARLGCLRALADIGGPQVCTFMLAAFDEDKAGEFGSAILNFLARLQYAPALGRMLDYLVQNPDEAQWQADFFFGKMGDKAVPFLLDRIDDPKREVRMLAVGGLGRVLMAADSYGRLTARFRIEPDPQVRMYILSALEYVSPTPDDVRAFSRRVVAQDKDPDVVDFATETIEDLDEFDAQARQFDARRSPSAEAFAAQYKTLYDSLGQAGDYGVLGAASTLADEPRLRRLRERVLQRDSEEAVYDYEKINHIIFMNRVARR